MWCLEVAKVFRWNFLPAKGLAWSIIALALPSIHDLISTSACCSREKLRTNVHGARKILRCNVLVESVAMLHSSDSVSATCSGFLLRGGVNSSGGACMDLSESPIRFLGRLYEIPGGATATAVGNSWFERFLNCFRHQAFQCITIAKFLQSFLLFLIFCNFSSRFHFVFDDFFSDM